mgnify:CR=1 FL=1
MRRRPESQSSSLATGARAGDPQRRGATLVLFAFLVVALLAMVAFGVDTGYILHIKTELKRAADAGALAGAGRLVDGEAEAVAEITQFVQMNLVGQEQVQGGDLQVEFGDWDEAAKVFTPGAEVPSAVRVRLERNDQPLFFGRVFGREMFDTQAESIAMYQPRDIMLVLDYSGSMNDDSELRSISTIGQSNVEANLAQIYTELGAPTFGNMQWTPVHISSNDDNFVLNQLGLNGVPYPYPGGSWLDYINYVQGSGYINAAGYQKDYGYLTWVNYLLERKPKSNETPDLWQTSEQPVTQVKNAVTIFLAYMQQVETDDRVGLSLYNSVAQTSVLESELTNDYAVIANIAQQRQAGHYDVWTNIGSGMQTARTELENNARPGAFRMMILMTDGIANKPTDTTVARQFVLDEAALAAAAGIPIVTISLGVNADAALMQSVADITNGVHFNVPGGEGVLQYEEQLEDVFKEVADDRPLKLVQ